jgi:Galactose oxidase, central domain
VSTGPGTGRWQRRADLPGARRAGHAMVFDPLRIAAVVTGGKPDPEQIGHEQVSECWEWSAVTDTWRRLPGGVGFSGGATLGAGLRDHDMFYDPKTGDTYVMDGRGPFGLEIVEFDRIMRRDVLSDQFGFLPGTRVTRFNSAVAYFAHRDALVLYGGQGFSGELNLSMEDIRFSGWPGANRPISNFPTQHPPPRSRHAMVYDSRRQVVVVFGGYGGPGFTRHADTWELVSYVPGEVWVNFAHQGIENGTFAFPFNTLAEGVAAAPDHGTVRLAGGGTADTGTFARPMTWRAAGAPVTLGR